MTRTVNPYEQDLDKNAANYAPLTPLSFIERAAAVFPGQLAVVHGAQRFTWRDSYARARRLGSALTKRGIGVGDTVAAMLPNVPPMFEAHFGVPMTGAVLNTLNTRLDADAKWGETPCAFVELKTGASATEPEIIAFCRERMARFKAPRAVVFGELPKTSTGKIQKFLLREKAKSAAAIDR